MLDPPKGSLRLIGQYDSPFTRRVGIALVHYGIDFEHVPWSVWADADALAHYNPLRRVPTLVLHDGMVLAESFGILDYLDERVGPARALLPHSGPMRRDGLRIAGLAVGIAEKAVSLLYEYVLRAEDQRNAPWIERCEAQIRDGLCRLEADRAGRSTEFWLGPQLSHADIAVACALRFTSEAHPALARAAIVGALAAHAAFCESLPVFQAVAQPLAIALER